MKSLIKFLFLVIAAITAINFIQGADFDPVVTGIALFSFAALVTMLVIPYRYFNNGQLNMGLDINIWKKYIIEKFRATNEFMFKSKDDSGSVLGGAVVYIPQAGADPEVEIDSNVYPGVISQRTDTDVNYVLQAYRTKPTHIPWVSLQTISYDKMDSVLGGHTAALSEAVAKNMLIKWGTPLAGANIIKTTGNNIAAVSTQVGDRKGLDHTDLKKAMIRMNVTNVPKAGRVALLDDNMYEYFYDSLSANMANAFNQFADMKSGIVGRLHGFDIMTRTSVLEFSAADAIKAFGSALAATDNLASLCWHPDTVCHAFGEIKPFQDKDNPAYYGDIYSMICRCGGRQERADLAGVVGIVQDAA